MIIKKGKVGKDTNRDDDKPFSMEKKTKEPQAKSKIAEGPRPERRRGDRRRGYRRIDDRNLISRAHEESNAIKEMASRDGFEYGLEVAQDQLKELNIVINDLLTVKEKTMDLLLNDVADMAIKVAEKIIQKEVSTDPQIVLKIASEAIKEMGKGHQTIIIKVNKADLNMVKQHLPEIYPYADSKTNIVVLEDSTVDWGSCIVETNTGLLDASFSTQLSILKKAFEKGF